MRFFLYCGACCGLSPGEGLVDLAAVGISLYAGFALAGSDAFADDELDLPGADDGAAFGGGEVGP